jgi:hypothetical protein
MAFAAQLPQRIQHDLPRPGAAASRACWRNNQRQIIKPHSALCNGVEDGQPVSLIVLRQQEIDSTTMRVWCRNAESICMDMLQRHQFSHAQGQNDNRDWHKGGARDEQQPTSDTMAAA